MEQDGVLTGNEFLIDNSDNCKNWKLKSLNSGVLQSYSMSSSSGPRSPHSQNPKILKINNTMFCILLNNCLTVFRYTDEAGRQRNNKSKFEKKTISNIVMPDSIEWLEADGVSVVYVASSTEVVGIYIGDGADNRQNWPNAKQVFRNQYNHVKGLTPFTTNLRKSLMVLTKQQVFIYDTEKEYQLIRSCQIDYSQESSGWSEISKINGISIIAESVWSFYFIGTSVELRTEVWTKLGRQKPGNKDPMEKKCEALYLAKIEVRKNKAFTRIFIIDHIFELGIFNRSRAYQVGKQTFILRLFEEIIVIKRNFAKFMVWDNVSIASSKINQKKGQLVLADKQIMIYTENGEISAHEICFNFSRALLETPKIDSFKGNNNEEEVLYDAVILQYRKDQYMKVLFYFKQAEVYIPNRSVSVGDSNGGTSQKADMYFHLMCIQQTEPNEKLKEMLEKNKGQEEIYSFLKRFNIKEVRYKKSEWEVSSKGEKQIEDLLLNIKDNSYIQEELTKILKQKPHDLQFLIAIQRRQIDRYRFMVASQLVLYEESSDNFATTKQKEQVGNLAMQTISEMFLMRELDQIKLSIQWLLESKMLYKKLLYSMNFLTFKEYDFIEISKLRTASLREEIKLLGVKGFEKRLKYFFNCFKYALLDDFKSIIRFVIADLSELEIRNFFMVNFPFILPSYNQDHEEQICRLWDNTFQEDLSQIETVELFKQEIIDEISRLSNQSLACQRIPMEQAVKAFNTLFNEFMESPWFIENSYKQHCLLQHRADQLQSNFLQLRDTGVYDIIVEFMYEKVDKGHFKEQRVREVIEELITSQMFPIQYTTNIYARLELYNFITIKVQSDPKKYLEVQIPQRMSFLIVNQHVLFDFLIRNFRQYLIINIKIIYDYQSKQLFISNLQKFLSSELPVLPNLISLLSYVQEPCHQQIRNMLLNSIYQRMNLSDIENAQNLIQHFSEDQRQPFNKQSVSKQVIVAYTAFLTPLFTSHNISATYRTLLQETELPTLPKSSILCQILSSYLNKNGHRVEFTNSNPYLIRDQLPTLDFAQIIDFLSILFYAHQKLNYQFDIVLLWRQLLIEYIDQCKFQEIGTLVDTADSFGREVEDRQLAQKWPNYQALIDFKYHHSLKNEFESVVLQWVDNKYQQLAALLEADTAEAFKQKVKDNFFWISKTLQILNQHTSSPSITIQISLIWLFSNLMKLSPKLLAVMLPSLIKQGHKYVKISTYSFMINLINLLDISSPMFQITSRQQILQLLSDFTQIQKQYGVAFGHQQTKTEDLLTGQFCRFNAEFSNQLVQWGYPRIAAFLLLDLFNSTYYYQDVLFYFLSHTTHSSKVQTKVFEKVVYECLVTDHHQDLRKIFNSYLVSYELWQSVSWAEVEANTLTIFRIMLENNKLDEAFFFGIRNTQIEQSRFLQIALSLQKFREDHVIAQTLVMTFIRAVKDQVEGQHWPTFPLFKSKINKLMKPQQRMEVVKDIAIVIGHLEIQFLKQKVADLQKNHKDVGKGQTKQKKEKERKWISFHNLKTQYENYMRVENMNPLLCISSEQLEPTAMRIQKYPDYSVDERKSQQSYLKILPIIREKQSEEVKELRKKLFENEHKLKQIQDANRQLMEENITPGITQVKNNAEKEHMSLVERKKKNKQKEELQAALKLEQEEQQERNQQSNQKLAKLNEEEKQNIAAIRKNPTSKIVQETQNLIAELREKRRKAKEETTASYWSEDERKQRMEEKPAAKSGLYLNRNQIGDNKIGIDEMKSSGLYSAWKSGIYSREEVMSRIDMMKESMRGNTYHRQLADKNSDFYVPRWQPKVPMRNQFEELVNEKPKTSDLIEKMKKSALEDGGKKTKEKQKEKQKQQYKDKEKEKKLSVRQLVDKYKALGQVSAAEQIEKICLIVTNSRTSAEILKKLYSQIKQIQTFVNLCRDLLQFSPSASEFIEHKSLKIAEDSLKIKIAIPVKQILPAHLFTTVHNCSIKDYYQLAYEIMKHNIMRLLQQPNCNVNSIAMMIRYGLGSEAVFYHRVFEDYMKSLLEGYEKKPIPSEKDLMLLAEKLRANFGSLSPENRKLKLEEMIKSIKDREKRRRVLRGVEINLENRSSIVNQQVYEELRIVLAKLTISP